MSKYKVQLINPGGADTLVYEHDTFDDALRFYQSYDTAEKVLAEFGNESMFDDETVEVELELIEDAVGQRFDDPVTIDIKSLRNTA